MPQVLKSADNVSSLPSDPNMAAIQVGHVCHRCWTVPAWDILLSWRPMKIHLISNLEVGFLPRQTRGGAGCSVEPITRGGFDQLLKRDLPHPMHIFCQTRLGTRVRFHRGPNFGQHRGDPAVDCNVRRDSILSEQGIAGEDSLIENDIKGHVYAKLAQLTVSQVELIPKEGAAALYVPGAALYVPVVGCPSS